MTSVLEPTTSAGVDLVTERWEVETAAPMFVTGRLGPGEADFVLMSHSEQSQGDFPVELGDGRELLVQLNEYVTDMFDLTVRDAALFSNGNLLATNNPELRSFDVPVALRNMLVWFVREGTDIQRMAQSAMVEDALIDFPIPIFGSPPNGWEKLGSAASGTSIAVFTGLAYNIHQPVMVAIGLGTTLLVWFARPSVRVLRRSMGERLASRLGTTYKEEDER